jgi:hypothetical protein
MVDDKKEDKQTSAKEDTVAGNASAKNASEKKRNNG